MGPAGCFRTHAYRAGIEVSAYACVSITYLHIKQHMCARARTHENKESHQQKCSRRCTDMHTHKSSIYTRQTLKKRHRVKLGMTVCGDIYAPRMASIENEHVRANMSKLISVRILFPYERVQKRQNFCEHMYRSVRYIYIFILTSKKSKRKSSGTCILLVLRKCLMVGCGTRPNASLCVSSSPNRASANPNAYNRKNISGWWVNKRENE